MRKKTLILLFIGMLSLSSCSIGGSRTGMINEDIKQADARLEQVLEAIKNRDTEALKGMFSKQALDEAEEFDERMACLFDFFQGEPASWENINGGPTTHESHDNGNMIKKSKSYYYVNTKEQRYFVFLSECTVDTENPNNEGLYTLLAIKAEDKETQWDNGDDSTFFPGIYKAKE